MQAADLTSANCWDNVVDFRWHKATASPHWKVLPEAQRRDPCDLVTLVVGQATETQAMQMEARSAIHTDTCLSERIVNKYPVILPQETTSRTGGTCK